MLGMVLNTLRLKFHNSNFLFYFKLKKQLCEFNTKLNIFYFVSKKKLNRYIQNTSILETIKYI